MDRFFIDTSKVSNNQFYIEGTEKTVPKKDNLASRLWNGTKKALYMTGAGAMALYTVSCSGPDRAYPEVDHPSRQNIGGITYNIQDSDPNGIFAALPREAGLELKLIEDSAKKYLRLDVKGTNDKVIDLQAKASKLLFKYEKELNQKGIYLTDGAQFSSNSEAASAGELPSMVFAYK